MAARSGPQVGFVLAVVETKPDKTKAQRRGGEVTWRLEKMDTRPRARTTSTVSEWISRTSWSNPNEP